MIKPEFLPFESTDLSPEQAIIAGMYLLSLEVALSQKVDVYAELTGTERIVGFSIDATQQQIIVSKVARYLNLHVGVNHKFDVGSVLGRFQQEQFVG